MRQQRKKKQTERTFVGFHPDDVQEHLVEQERQILQIKDIIELEAHRFADMHRQKREALKMLEDMLAEALEEEKRMLEGQAPS